VDKSVVLIGTVLLVGLIVWWFFGKRTTETVVATVKGNRQTVEVVVDGGYSPSIVEFQRGMPAEIIFVRKDASACFEEVVLPDFGVRTHLPVGKPFAVTINPNEAGEYKYACGMNMFFGKVVVK